MLPLSKKHDEGVGRKLLEPLRLCRGDWLGSDAANSDQPPTLRGNDGAQLVRHDIRGRLEPIVDLLALQRRCPAAQKAPADEFRRRFRQPESSPSMPPGRLWILCLSAFPHQHGIAQFQLAVRLNARRLHIIGMDVRRDPGRCQGSTTNDGIIRQTARPIGVQAKNPATIRAQRSLEDRPTAHKQRVRP